MQSEDALRKELADRQAEMDAAFASGDYVTAAGLADTVAGLRAPPAARPVSSPHLIPD